MDALLFSFLRCPPRREPACVSRWHHPGSFPQNPSNRLELISIRLAARSARGGDEVSVAWPSLTQQAAFLRADNAWHMTGLWIRAPGEDRSQVRPRKRENLPPNIGSSDPLHCGFQGTYSYHSESSALSCSSFLPLPTPCHALLPETNPLPSLVPDHLPREAHRPTLGVADHPGRNPRSTVSDSHPN